MPHHYLNNHCLGKDGPQRAGSATLAQAHRGLRPSERILCEGRSVEHRPWVGLSSVQPLQRIKDFVFFTIPRSGSRTGLGLVDDLSLFRDIGHSFLRKRGAKNVSHKVLDHPFSKSMLIRGPQKTLNPECRQPISM
jgi:hypothetical protein